MSANHSKTSAQTGGPSSGRGVVAATMTGRSRTPWIIAGAVGLAVLVLFGIYQYGSAHSSKGPASDRYSVGSPGVGAMAPDFALPNVAGPGAPVTTRLSDYRGKTVMLYFHEGLGCQPCWNQIRDLQNSPATLTSLGVDQVLTITSGPPDLVAQKTRDDKLTAPALVDTDLLVSKQYQANQYGMMGTDRDGHTFVLVGPDGTIQWRADYGGSPNYTMYVEPGQLVSDVRAARVGS